jgi:ADP-ribose pyrophosphatase
MTLELPAGKMEKGEDPLFTIKRELKEETGYTAKTYEKLFAFYPSTAFSNELLHVWVAKDLSKGEQMPDDDEFVANEIMPFEQALEMIKIGKIIDSKTMIALLYYKLWQAV